MSLSVPLFCVVMSFDFAVLALFYSLFHSGFVQDIFYCSLEHVFNVSRTFNVTFLHKCLKQFHYTFTLLLNFTEIVHKSLAALAHISLFSYICLLPLSCMRLMQSSYTDNLMLWYITVQLSYSFFQLSCICLLQICTPSHIYQMVSYSERFVKYRPYSFCIHI